MGRWVAHELMRLAHLCGIAVLTFTGPAHALYFSAYELSKRVLNKLGREEGGEVCVLCSFSLEEHVHLLPH